jgi:hypothetical protein
MFGARYEVAASQVILRFCVTVRSRRGTAYLHNNG